MPEATVHRSERWHITIAHPKATPAYAGLYLSGKPIAALTLPAIEDLMEGLTAARAALRGGTHE